MKFTYSYISYYYSWSALHAPFDWTADPASNPLAETLVKIKQPGVTRATQLDDIRYWLPCMNSFPSIKNVYLFSNELHPYGYDQWGAIFGSALVGDDDDNEKEIYMRGELVQISGISYL